MSEKRRGRPRDKWLDKFTGFYEKEVQTRMSMVNRRDMMLAFDSLKLGTPEGKEEFAYLVNNGYLRMSILTELGRYVRRYGMSDDDVIYLAGEICNNKMKAKDVRELLEFLFNV